ncbi:MAG TPA: serine/threonine protein kinase [Planctomycetes bacterium]|nr:serine/threonine protein kinase [Planctomycetota bacterium]
MNKEEARFLARLVHGGFVPEAELREALGNRREGEAGPEALPDLLARHGLMERNEAQRLLESGVGEHPRLRRYELGPLLGEGRQARIFEARDLRDGKKYALKILREEQARDPEKLARFLEEGKALCTLHCQGLVRAHRLAKDQGTYFVVLDLLEGRDLLEELRERGRLPEEEALAIVHSVARTLCALRREGMIHRDIKPSNIHLLREGGTALLDLGFAVQEGSLGDSETTVGTLAYIAPEQAEGRGDLDGRADIYALGATLYHLAVGEPPFAGEDEQELLLRQIQQPLDSSKIRDLDLSPTLHYFIEKMMAKDREIRYPDPEALVRDLEEKAGPFEPPRPRGNDRRTRSGGETKRPTELRRRRRRRRR